MLTPLTPITNKYEHKMVIKAVLTHPMLGEVGTWFSALISSGEVDLLINDLWDTLSEEMECNPNELTTAADLDVDLNEIVYELVSHCNNPMNFPPGDAPPPMKAEKVLLKVAEVLGKN